jgi:hypothetical protein
MTSLETRREPHETHRQSIASCHGRAFACDVSYLPALRSVDRLLIVRQFIGCASSGICGPTKKVGEQFEFPLFVSGVDLVHPAVHSA